MHSENFYIRLTNLYLPQVFLWCWMDRLQMRRECRKIHVCLLVAGLKSSSVMFPSFSNHE